MKRFQTRLSSLPVLQISFSEDDDLRDLLKEVRWREGQKKIRQRDFLEGICFFCSNYVFSKEGIDHSFGFPYRVVGFIPEREIFVLQRIFNRSFI